jgi:hypothetical protein
LTETPYHAPGTPLEKSGGRAPAQIKIALALLWAVLIAEAVIPLIFVFGGSSGRGVADSIGLIVLLTKDTFVMMVLLVFVGRRHDWARWVYLVLTVIGILDSFGTVFLVEAPEGSDWFFLVAQIENLLDIVGLVLLFTGAGAKWFKPEAVAAS